MVKKRKGDREHMVYPATRRRGDHDVGVLETSSAAGTSAQAPSKSATKSAPLRLTASCALANGSSLPLSSASLLPPLALSSTGPGPSRKLMSRASQKNRLIAANSEGSYIVGRGSMGGDCLRNGMLTSHYRGVSYLVFSDDGTLLISGSEDGGFGIWSWDMVDAKPLSCQHLRITRVWSVGSGRLLRNIVFPTIIDAVALDPGENIFFAGGRDGKIYVAALNARAHLPASMGSISSIVSRITGPAFF
ncbi:hypothetical protein ACFX2B_042592 [Malus domestica]